MKRMYIFILFFISSIVMGSTKMKVISHWDYGGSYDIVASGKYLYAGAGGQVRIYDISTKEKINNIKMEPIHLFYKEYGTYKEKTPPVKILHTGVGTIHGLFADKNYLYVIGSKFVIADISKPEKAYIVSSLNIGGKDVHVHGNYAYLTTPSPYGDDITIIDISDKKKPKKIGGIDIDKFGGHWNNIRRLYADGKYVYTGGVRNWLYIIDVSDPKNPKLVGKFPNDRLKRVGISSVAKKDNYVFVVAYHYGFCVIDVSDPKNPKKVAEVIKSHDPNASDIKIVGDLLFLSTRYEGFRIYDIKDPKNPKLVTKFGGFRTYAEGIFFHKLPYGKYVFETGWSGGWAIIDVTDIKNPKFLSHMPVPLGDSVKVKGNYMYIGSHNHGIWVVDVSKPEKPKWIAFIQVGGRNKGLCIDGDYLYGTGCWGGLWIVNISDPKKPLIETLDFGPNADFKPIVVGNYLYSQTYDAKTQYVTVYDISNKKKPKIVYRKDLGFGYGMHPFDKYKENYLIWGGEKGLFIVDISDRKNPKVVSKCNIDMYLGDAKVVGNILYALGGNYLYAIDISDVKNPKILGKVKCSGNALVIYHSVAYVLPRIIGRPLKAVDISDPSHLSVIDKLDGIGGDDYSANIDEENGLLFTNSGFIISTIK